MSRLEVRSFSLSIDGYGAGSDQRRDQGLGRGGERLHEWMFATRTWQRMQGRAGGETGIDDDFAARGFAGVGGWIMGRNIFGPIRGPTPGEGWEAKCAAEQPTDEALLALAHQLCDKPSPE